MNELKEGYVTQQDLANWFGISLSAVKNLKDKPKRLKTLSAFCDFHFEKNKIYIDKVFIPIYSKAYAVIEEKLPDFWHKNNLDTCARVGRAIYDNCNEVSGQIKLSTAKTYTNRAKIKLFGRNHIETDRGTLGTSRYIWGTIDENGECHYLTDEQYKKIDKCSSESYGSVLGNKAALLNDALNKNEITEAEFCEGMKMTKEERCETYYKFEELVVEALGFMPERLTEVTYVQFFEE